MAKRLGRLLFASTALVLGLAVLASVSCTSPNLEPPRRADDAERTHAGPQAMSETQLTEALRGKFVTSARADGTRTVGNSAELFCENGRWWSIGGPALVAGIYVLQDNRACIRSELSPEFFCRAFFVGESGRLYIRNWTGAQGETPVFVPIALYEAPSEELCAN